MPAFSKFLLFLALVSFASCASYYVEDMHPSQIFSNDPQLKIYQTFHVYTSNQCKHKKCAMMVILHGIYSNPGDQIWLMLGSDGGKQKAFENDQNEPMVLVFLKSLNVGWDYTENAPKTDSKFIDNVIDYIIQHRNIDKNRVGTLGFSSGAIMSERYACTEGGRQRLAYIIPYAASSDLRERAGCQSKVHVMWVHSPYDMITTYDGSSVTSSKRESALAQALSNGNQVSGREIECAKCDMYMRCFYEKSDYEKFQFGACNSNGVIDKNWQYHTMNLETKQFDYNPWFLQYKSESWGNKICQDPKVDQCASCFPDSPCGKSGLQNEFDSTLATTKTMKISNDALTEVYSWDKGGRDCGTATLYKMREGLGDNGHAFPNKRLDNWGVSVIYIEARKFVWTHPKPACKQQSDEKIDYSQCTGRDGDSRCPQWKTTCIHGHGQTSAYTLQGYCKKSCCEALKDLAFLNRFNNRCNGVKCKKGFLCNQIGQCISKQNSQSNDCEGISCESGKSCQNGKCTCDNGSQKSNCSKDLCQGISCGNGKSCKNGQCLCENGSKKQDCTQEKDLCEGVSCGQGQCQQGKCQCKDGYTGQNCEKEDDSNQGDCFCSSQKVFQNDKTGGFECKVNGQTQHHKIFYTREECTEEGGQPSPYTCEGIQGYAKSLKQCPQFAEGFQHCCADKNEKQCICKKPKVLQNKKTAGYACIKNGETLHDQFYTKREQCTSKGGQPDPYSCEEADEHASNINQCGTYAWGLPHCCEQPGAVQKKEDPCKGRKNKNGNCVKWSKNKNQFCIKGKYVKWMKGNCSLACCQRHGK